MRRLWLVAPALLFTTWGCGESGEETGSSERADGDASAPLSTDRAGPSAPTPRPPAPGGSGGAGDGHGGEPEPGGEPVPARGGAGAEPNPTGGDAGGGSPGAGARGVGGATSGAAGSTDAAVPPPDAGVGDGTEQPAPSAPASCEAPSYDESGFDVVYEVGPGLEFETPSDVPWESLGPGTLVKVHHRAEPYRDKWVINVAGTESDPVVVLGVPANGALPVISGADAVTRPELDFTGEERSVIKIGTSNAPANDRPSHITVACLDIRNARPGYTFTNDSGATSEYADNAAAITIEIGDHIAIENCELHDAGNGLFSAHDTSDLLISGNYIHDNGNPGSIYEHNSYTESSRITFQWNHYGPLCDGCEGNNLKDRSAGTVIRYNWIENGNRQLDLVETGDDAIADLPEYRQTFVYGNVLVEADGAGNSQILHYGGDGEGRYRAGTLYLYHNTIVSTRAGNTTLARLSTNDEALAAYNNVLAGGSFAILDGAGAALLRGNFLPTGWRETHGTLEGTVENAGNTVGDDPGFVDAEGQDFRLAASSEAISAALGLPPAALPVVSEYVPHQTIAPRTLLSDPGAFQSE